MFNPRYIFLPALASIFLLPGCEEPNAGLNLRSRIEAGCSFQGDECFADQPLKVRALIDEVRADVQFRIAFGDGKTEVVDVTTGTNTTQYLYHPYAAPGTYTIEIQDLDGNVLNDTTITFRKPLKRIKSRVITLGKKYIWQGPSHEYYLIHNTTKFTQPDFGYDRMIVTKLTESFDSVSTGIPFDDMKGYATNVVALPSGNFVQVRDGALEQMDITGLVLSHKDLGIQKIKYMQLSLASVNDQLKITSDSRYDLLLTTTDLTGNVIDSKTIIKPVDTQTTGIPRFTPAGDFVTFYYKSQADPTQVVIYDKNGDVKATAVDFSYPFPAEIYSVDDGVVMLHRSGTVFGDLAKWDSQGQLKWRVDHYFKLSEDPISVFSFGGDTWIFYGDMEGARINATGKFVWKKKFATTRDMHNVAMMNKKGNFVVVGTRHCDFLREDKFPCDKQFLSEFKLSDRILIEVDKDGNIVDH